MLSAIELALSLLTSVLSAATKNKLATEVTDGIQAAITSLQAVQATPTTYAQLEGLRVKPTF